MTVTLVCAACGKSRHVAGAAADPGPCECGGTTFRSTDEIRASLLGVPLAHDDPDAEFSLEFPDGLEPVRRP